MGILVYSRKVDKVFEKCPCLCLILYSKHACTQIECLASKTEYVLYSTAPRCPYMPFNVIAVKATNTKLCIFLSQKYLFRLQSINTGGSNRHFSRCSDELHWNHDATWSVSPRKV